VQPGEKSEKQSGGKNVMDERRRRQIIVTGGGTGIGREITRTLAADGADALLLGRRTETLARAAAELHADIPDAQIIWRTCDVSAVEQVDALGRWFGAEGPGALDVLVNNAGGVEPITDDASLAEAAQWAQRILANNLLGTYLITRTLMPFLRRPGGRIINLSSIAAVRGGGDMYSAAKAGVIGLTYALAGELAADGVTVNAIAPGLTLDTEFFGDRMTEERLRRTLAQIPAGHAGHPADIAAATRYLASADAAYVTGQVLHVNGGWIFGR
jgi:3-oxoacyl-[acyl-carrier protein] reductase